MRKDTKQTAENTFKSVMQTFQANLKQLNVLKREHASYMLNSIESIGPSIIGYDVSHAWVVFYITNGLNILNQQGLTINEDLKKRCIKFLSYCKADGGFSGGDGQIAHLAGTYAAFLAILSLGPSAYHLIDKEQMYQLFKRRRQGNTFTMMEYGECDLRGIYIVVIIVKLLKMNEDVIQGVEEYILDCQTHEGGLTNIRGAEAHGGYTFCGIAALSMLGKLEKLDISRLLLWLSQRQVEVLGGFNGRTNKLVDSCYSFWIGAVFNILNDYFKGRVEYKDQLLYSQELLQQYIIRACQEKEGGLVDKPQKSRDLYHTCYSLSGLALSQFKGHLLGGIESNLLSQIDPVYHVTLPLLQRAREHEWK